MNDWSVNKSRKLYNLPGWGGDFFDINQSGHACVRTKNGKGVPLSTLVTAAQQEGLRLPILFRFNHILHERLFDLCEAFHQVSEELGYHAPHTAIYPIKVNQQHSVVKEIIAAGQKARVGLEAGSKPELIAVLGVADPGDTIICNGYKDHEYLRLALHARTLGIHAYIVIEKPDEAKAVIKLAEEMHVKPLLGLRVRLASTGNGKWQNSGGEKGKFGLSATQLLKVIEQLRNNNLLDYVHLLHFHMGSQIANIRDIQEGVREAGRFYTDLRQLGAPMNIVDIGGGLAVDYEGTHTRNECSMNYSLTDYATAVLNALKIICDQEGQPHPQVFTESGRAMTAHHAVLITNVIDIETADIGEPSSLITANASTILLELSQLKEQLLNLPNSEIWHEATYCLDKAHQLYSQGAINLEERAEIETVFLEIAQMLHQHSIDHPIPNLAMKTWLDERLADKLFCNFSVFQSTPDIWGINQVFPVMPLQRLNHYPNRRGIMQDLTCDSDGQIQQYVVGHSIESTLPIHDIQLEENYLLGIFLVGAYQEILGDLHNLFGDTDSVNVDINDQGDFRLAQAESGDSTAELLSYVHFDPDALRRLFRRKTRGLPRKKAENILNELEASLNGYTYLE